MEAMEAMPCPTLCRPSQPTHCRPSLPPCPPPALARQGAALAEREPPVHMTAR